MLYWAWWTMCNCLARINMYTFGSNLGFLAPIQYGTTYTFSVGFYCILSIAVASTNSVSFWLIFSIRFGEDFSLSRSFQSLWSTTFGRKKIVFLTYFNYAKIQRLSPRSAQSCSSSQIKSWKYTINTKTHQTANRSPFFIQNR